MTLFAKVLYFPLSWAAILVALNWGISGFYLTLTALGLNLIFIALLGGAQFLFNRNRQAPKVLLVLTLLFFIPNLILGMQLEKVGRLLHDRWALRRVPKIEQTVSVNELLKIELEFPLWVQVSGKILPEASIQGVRHNTYRDQKGVIQKKWTQYAYTALVEHLPSQSSGVVIYSTQDLSEIQTNGFASGLLCRLNSKDSLCAAAQTFSVNWAHYRNSADAWSKELPDPERIFVLDHNPGTRLTVGTAIHAGLLLVIGALISGLGILAIGILQNAEINFFPVKPDSKAVDLDAKSAGSFLNSGLGAEVSRKTDRDRQKPQKEAQKMTQKEAEDFFQEGVRARHAGEFDRALECFEKLRSMYRGYEGKCLLEMGLVHADCKQYEQAMEFYSEALKKHPRFAMAYMERAFCLASLNEHEAAILDWGRVIDCTDEQSMRNLAYWERGMCLNTVGDVVLALEDLKIATDWEEDAEADLAMVSKRPLPDNLLIRRERSRDRIKESRLAMERRDRQTAEELAQAAFSDLTMVLSQRPDDAEALFLRGSLSYLYHVQINKPKGKAIPPQEGLADLNRSIELYPDNAGAYHFRAQYLRKLGRSEESAHDRAMAEKLKNDAEV